VVYISFNMNIAKPSASNGKQRLLESMEVWTRRSQARGRRKEKVTTEAALGSWQSTQYQTNETMPRRCYLKADKIYQL
jgi:hypothetical protein